jgi:hypothetical protein
MYRSKDPYQYSTSLQDSTGYLNVPEIHIYQILVAYFNYVQLDASTYTQTYTCTAQLFSQNITINSLTQSNDMI